MDPLNDHYSQLSADFDALPFYQPGSPYQQWMCAQVAAQLRLEASHRLADIGGGTGSFAVALCQQSGLLAPPTVIEPNPDMAAAAAQRGLAVQRSSALEFAARSDQEPFDRLLLKECLHHIPAEDHLALLRGLRGRLRPAGRLVIVARIEAHPTLPFCGPALRAWRQSGLDEPRLLSDLRAAGFDATVARRAFPMALGRDRWAAFLRRRAWTFLAQLSDEEIEDAIAAVSQAHPGGGPLQCEDSVRFICAGTGHRSS